MGRPIVFWYSSKLDHILNPPHHTIEPPTGYVKIECRHAHEVDTWSKRLRAQEKRIAGMTDHERYLYEDKIRAHAIEQIKKDIQNKPDDFNRKLAVELLRRMEASRAKAAVPVLVEGVMACEKEEGIAP